MKQLLLAGTAFLAIAAAHSAVNAEPIVFDFTYTGSLVTFTVPTTDQYQILAFGAQGEPFAAPPGAQGGRGAEIGGSFSLTAGEILRIAVGGAGIGQVPAHGGGGGGSFVVGPGNTPLVIAGGGGGFGSGPVQGGLTGEAGGGPGGGIGGSGGAAGVLIGFPGNQRVSGGGGGVFSAGGSAPPNISGGGAFPDLGGGSFGGGFGGGGGGGGAGGGGGGYSGGAGGDARPSIGGPGFGGGSFNAGTDQILVADFRVGNGEVIITELPTNVPEPASLALLCPSLLGFVIMARRRR